MFLHHALPSPAVTTTLVSELLHERACVMALSNLKLRVHCTDPAIVLRRRGSLGVRLQLQPAGASETSSGAVAGLGGPRGSATARTLGYAPATLTATRAVAAS